MDATVHEKALVQGWRRRGITRRVEFARSLPWRIAPGGKRPSAQPRPGSSAGHGKAHGGGCAAADTDRRVGRAPPAHTTGILASVGIVRWTSARRLLQPALFGASATKSVLPSGTDTSAGPCGLHPGTPSPSTEDQPPKSRGRRHPVRSRERPQPRSRRHRLRVTPSMEVDREGRPSRS